MDFLKDMYKDAEECFKKNSFDLNEAKLQINDSDIEKIKNMTSRNQHNDARSFGASLLKNKKLEKAYECIETLHLFFGHLPQELSSIRNQLDQILFKSAKRLLDGGYERFYGAY